MKPTDPGLFAGRFFRLVGLIIFAALFEVPSPDDWRFGNVLATPIQTAKSKTSAAGADHSNGSVFQWIEFQIPILKMQVRFLPGLPKRTEENLSLSVRFYFD